MRLTHKQKVILLSIVAVVVIIAVGIVLYKVYILQQADSSTEGTDIQKVFGGILYPYDYTLDGTVVAKKEPESPQGPFGPNQSFLYVEIEGQGEKEYRTISYDQENPMFPKEISAGSRITITTPDDPNDYTKAFLLARTITITQ